MLVITRRKREKVIIADNIEITILDIRGKTVRFGVNAPKEIPVHTRIKVTVSEDEAKPSESRDTHKS